LQFTAANLLNNFPEAQVPTAIGSYATKDQSSHAADTKKIPAFKRRG
jgi:hypothetical protein